MIVGYARVSTIDQTPQLQIDALKAAKCKPIYANKVPLKLGQYREDVEDEPSAGPFGIDVLCQRKELDAGVLEAFNNLKQVAQRTTQTVQLPDDEGIAFPQHVEETGELRPVHVLAALLLNAKERRWV
jgi:hypothetical protein